MTRHTIKLPKLGDTADEVVVLEWLVQIGDRVEDGSPILRVETSKVETEVNSPVSGVLVQQLVNPGDDVSVGSPVAAVQGD